MSTASALLHASLQHHQAGRLAEAEAGYARVLELEPKQPDALYLLGLIAHQAGRHEDAVALVGGAIAVNPNVSAFHNTLGDAWRLLGRLGEAEQALRRAIALQPSSVDALTNLALVLHGQHRFPESVALLFEVLAVQRARPELDRLLVSMLHGTALPSASDSARAVLLRLCESNDVAAQSLAGAVLALVTGSPAFSELQQVMERDADPFVVARPDLERLIREPLLLAALPCMVFADVLMERFLTWLRAAVLRGVTIAAGTTTQPTPPGTGTDTVSGTVSGTAPVAAVVAPTIAPFVGPFAAALAHQCFNTEYAYYVSDTETGALEALRVHATAMLVGADRDADLLELTLAVLAAYAPLHALADAHRLVDGPQHQWSVGFQSLIQTQVLDHAREGEIAEGLPALTAITDEVSNAVRGMYEENPYPRWVSVDPPGPLTFASLMERLRPGVGVPATIGDSQILIAGCGSGRQPIQTALQFSASAVLAVDLSRASLAYATRMAQQLGVANITFAQADLLELATLDRTFDIVSCSGVLHHLADPLAGWRSLLRLLAPQGVMKIGLYATKARGSVEAARAFVRQTQFAPTPDGIRETRRALLDLPYDHSARGVIAFLDFFSLSGCRDLLMHVQERTYTIAELTEAMETLELSFLGFQVSDSVQRRFDAQFTDPAARLDLASWDTFETLYPETFAGMYQFWCCRRD